MGNPVQFLGWNTSGGGQRVINGDEYVTFNFTDTPSSDPDNTPLRIQRNCTSFFELLNDSGVKVASNVTYIGSDTPALDIQGFRDHAGGILKVYDQDGGHNVLVVKRTTNATGRITEFVVGDASQAGADSVGACFSYDTRSASPLGKVASFGYTGAGPGYAFNELMHFHSDGTLHMSKSSGANIVWDTSGGGTIGSMSGGNRPAGVYASSVVLAQSVYGGASATLGNNSSLTNFSLTLTGDSPGSSNKIIYADDGTADKPALQFDEATNKWQAANDGLTFADLVTSLSLTWDAVYDNDADGLTIDTAAKPFAITQTSTTGSAFTISRNLASGSTNSPIVTITNSHVSDDQSAFQITNYSTGYGIYIDHLNTGSPALYTEGLVPYNNGAAIYARKAGMSGALSTIYHQIGSYFSSVGITSGSGTVVGFKASMNNSTDDTASYSLYGAELALSRVTPTGGFLTAHGLVVSGKWSNGIYIDSQSTSGIYSNSPIGTQIILPYPNIGSFSAVTYSPTAGLGATEYHYGYLASSVGDAQDLAGSQIRAFQAELNVAYGGKNGGAATAIGYYAHSNLDYGLYSLAPVYVASTVNTQTLAVYQNSSAKNYSAIAAFGTLPIGRGLIESYKTGWAGTLADAYSMYRAVWESAGVITTGGGNLSGLAVNLANSASDTQSYTLYGTKCEFTRSTPISGTCIAIGYYANSNFDVGIWSQSPIAVTHTGATDLPSGTAMGQFSYTSPTAGAIAGTRRGVSVDMTADSDDTASFYGFRSYLGGTKGSGSYRGIYVTGSWDIGLYSESPVYVAVSGTDSVDFRTADITVTSPGLSATGKNRAITATVFGNAGDNASADLQGLYLVGSAVGSANKIGLYVDNNWTTGIYSRSKVSFNLNTAVASGASATTSSTFTSTGLSASTRGSAISCTVNGNASDNITSDLCGVYAIGNSTGASTKCGFRADAEWTYGLYSASKLYTVYSENTDPGNGYYVGSFTYISPTTGSLTGTRTTLYSLTTADDSDTATLYGIRSALTGTKGVADSYWGLSIDGNWDYGVRTTNVTPSPSKYAFYGTGQVYSTADTTATTGFNDYSGVNVYFENAGTGFTDSPLLCGVRSELYPASTDNGEYHCLHAEISSISNAATVGLYASSYMTYGIRSFSPAFISYTALTAAVLGFDACRVDATSPTAGLTGSQKLTSYKAIVVGDADDNASSSLQGFAAVGSSTGPSTKYAFRSYSPWTYSFYSDGGMLEASHTDTDDSQSYTLGHIKLVCGTDAAEVRKNALHVEINPTGSSNIGYVRGIYINRTNRTADSSIDFGLVVENSIEYGLFSYARQNLIAREHTDWESSTDPVLDVVNNLTTSTTAHALRATIKRNPGGMYAVALENTAQSSIYEGTKNHIGFTAAKTNVRVMPLEKGCSDQNGGTTDYFYFGTGTAPTNCLYWNQTAANNGKFWYYPLELPHGCTITKIRFYEQGGGGAATGTNLPYIALCSATFIAPNVLITEASGYATTTGIEVVTVNMSVTLDNAAKRYLVLFRNVATGAVAGATVYGLEVTYTIQDLGAAPGF